LIGEFLPRQQLTDADITTMYRLFRTHFDLVSEDRFRCDLHEKDWVVRIRDAERVYGFTSLRLLSIDDSSRASIVYSGDTIVAPQARFSTILARTWIHGVRQLSRDGDELYWFLLVSGFRTYRLLPVFWREFFPNFARPTPPRIDHEMKTAATRLFGSSFDAGEGVVRFAEPQPLRPVLSHISPDRLQDPHIRYFAHHNPGHMRGDELVCWTRLAEANLTEAGRRMWNATSASHVKVTGRSIRQDAVQP
jgi:hypothetical protein